ncbi:hypothetical protein MFLAVUS_001260 [Mucor flavus]|uniref:Uncharacterized protein n=1 Tax=Mucor flavus TaxID=439312 RepID=A0ABP9YM04_9FUNG
MISKCHPNHSLILDPEYVTWNDYFTKQELDEILSYDDPTITIDLSNKEGLDILMSNKLHSNIYSEDEIVGRVWKVISWAFDQGRIVAGRKISVRSNNYKNPVLKLYLYHYYHRLED